ncbi:hypothetical protein [Isoptericola sp. AK164]|uniref:hypothetical protein n=1 Tax=Isoptericola sp. AK164 TaxID=3024246 RepID=UPI0024183A59|nr:hypothetical protein [Isoptericola sp. AK164]
MAPRAVRRVLGVVLGLLLGTAAVVDSNPTLSVEPGAGAPETEVSVVVQGFTDCPDDTTDARRVELLWDGDELVGSVVLVLTGVAAVVEGGALVAVRGGSAEITGTLSLDGVRLVERRRTVDVRLLVHLRRPLVLA